MNNNVEIKRSGGSLWGVILILVGLAFLGDNLGWFAFDIWDILWPAIIIIVGIQLLMRRGRRIEIRTETTMNAGPVPPPPPAPEAPPTTFGTRSSKVNTDQINESHMMGELDLIVDSATFRGGAVSTVFGDIRVDCRSAILADGEQVLSLNTVFGQVRLVIPATWEYTVEATTVFGEVEASGVRRGGIFSNVVSATQGFGTAQRRLRINTSTVFGEVRIVQY